jgi:hypothetical protein
MDGLSSLLFKRKKRPDEVVALLREDLVELSEAPDEAGRDKVGQIAVPTPGRGAAGANCRGTMGEGAREEKPVPLCPAFFSDRGGRARAATNGPGRTPDAQPVGHHGRECGCGRC